MLPEKQSSTVLTQTSSSKDGYVDTALLSEFTEVSSQVDSSSHVQFVWNLSGSITLFWFFMFKLFLSFCSHMLLIELLMSVSHTAEKVAFTAVADQGGKHGPFDRDTKMVFGTDITNIAGAYDATSGIFKAPVKGVYYFRFTYHAVKKDKTGLTLMKGGDTIVHMHDASPSKPESIDNAGNGAVLQLNHGDEVYVTLPAGSAKVAFTAVADQGGQFGPFDKDRKMVFNTVITNITGAYDPTSGIFKAPVLGVYYFRFTYHANKKARTGLTLKKGGETIVHMHDYCPNKPETIDNAGNGAVLQLNPGEEVSVTLPAGCQLWADENMTSFTGFLLFQI
ncbi:uncharacterized protein V6R79_002477 [Siganus canaliculatus]